MAETVNDTKPKMSRKLKVLLIGSLSLNLLVAGLFVGAILRHSGPSDVRGNSDLLLRVLDKDDRRAIGSAVKEAQGGGRRAFWAGQKAALGDVAIGLAPRVIVAGLMLHNHVALNRNLAPRVGLFVNRNPNARIALNVLPNDCWRPRSKQKFVLTNDEPQRKHSWHAVGINSSDTR